jgi:hypothetical protein
MAPQTHSPFLNILPAELRLRIYEQLLVSSEPLKGPIARQGTKYNIQTAILRTNKQIYDEARPVFLGKNTFTITSVNPSLNTISNHSEEEEECSGAFEPPLQLVDLPLVRTGSWRPRCVGAERYIISLSYLLGAVGKSLLSLRLCADTRRYHSFLLENRDGEGEDEHEGTEIDIRRTLTGFYVADGSSRFRAALAKLSLISEVSLHYDFLEAYFDFVVQKEVLCRQSLVGLMGQVLVARSELRLKLALQELCEEAEVEVAVEGSVDLMTR